MRTLIIEDDEILSSTLSRRLATYGYICRVTDNSNDALLACHEFMPQVILLDMHLGSESGLVLLPLLRNAVLKTKIILITGFGSIATAVQAMKLGADDYLAKPIDTQTLLNTITGDVSSDKTAPPQQHLSSEQLEWEHINQALKVNQGNVSAAARQLSMHRRTLQRKLKKRPAFN